MSSRDHAQTSGSALEGVAELPRRVEALRRAASRVPLGHACRSCGSSTYNTLQRVNLYLETGATCCASLREWLDPATPVAMSAAERAAITEAAAGSAEGVAASVDGQVPGRTK